jgi:uncharacterized membrane protein YidH (DUF202 family)
MNFFYKMLPYAILTIVAGYMIGIGNSSNSWAYVGLGLIIAPVAILLMYVFILTLKHWRKNKSTTDKRLSDVSVMLIFNVAVLLLLFAYLIWKDIEILNDNMFLIVWMAANLGALRIIWVPKETESTPSVQIEEVEEEKNEEAV